MLPLELIRHEPDAVRRAADLKGEAAPVDEILDLDRRWREATTRAESLPAEQNRLSKEFGQSKDQALVPRMKSLADDAVDFVLEGGFDAWREMLDNIRSHGQADANHTINTLTHFGEKIRVLYDDPDGHDKLYRFVESIQQFFDLAAGLDVGYGSGEAQPAASV